jgi:N-acetylmuramoyl-L-alanine amidase
VLDLEASLERLCDPAAEVSAHWLIDRDGAVTALVDEGRRAWHAGRSRWGAARDVNARSIGVELVGDGAEPFPEAQMGALEGLLRGIVRRHRVPPERVLGHSDVAPGRKRDPGPLFDWGRLAALGLAVRPEAPGPADPARLPGALDAIGYDPEAAPAARLEAFRLRFRPGARGPADKTDAGIALAVARAWPCVDRPASCA